MRNTHHAGVALLLALPVLAGCGKTESAPTEPEVPQRDFTDPSALIAAYAECLNTMDYDRYAALLSPDFEYVPQDADVDDLPWLSPDHPWGRDEELAMIGHMMNPDFVSNETGETVDSIEVVLTVTNEQVVSDAVEVTCSADIQVLWTASSGAFSRVRFVFTLVTDGDGFLRIRKITELPEFG
ncbi:nuclear transport factor 2 family protein, partial [bacterium]|nr:nuclear transport factor 2 family protein [bacterium]